jgi:hypothetical protein
MVRVPTSDLWMCHRHNYRVERQVAGGVKVLVSAKTVVDIFGSSYECEGCDMKSRTAMTATSLLSGFSKLSRLSTQELRGLGDAMCAGHFGGNNVEQQLPSPDGPTVPSQKSGLMTGFTPKPVIFDL